MLTLLCGVSGSGKTERLLESIRRDVADKRPSFLLIPEQQALISESFFAERLPENAGLYFQIFSFSKLAKAVFKRTGGVTENNLSSGLRTVFLWDAIRTLSPSMRYFGEKNLSDMNLPLMMQQTLTEFAGNGVDSEKLEQALSNLPNDSVLQKKLADINAIQALYHENVKAAFGDDPSEQILRLAEKLKSEPFFANSRVYVDSFSGFTEQEYRVLRETLKQADEVTVSLCMNAGVTEAPFKSTFKCASRLSKIASQIGCDVRRIELPEPILGSSELSYLQRNLWNFSAKPIKSEENDVRLLRCANRYEECEAAAIEMEGLLQKGVKCNEITVFVRDLDAYRGILDAAMEKHSIPAFLSERTDLMEKPLSRLIFSALRATSRGFRREDVLALLKTGLCGIDLRDASLFEEYCETWNLTGARFTESVWSMNPDGLTVNRSARGEEILEIANRVRQELMKPLLSLSASMRASEKLSDRVQALYRYLCDLQISNRLSLRAKQELEANNPKAAGETVRLYRFCTDTLTELCRFFGDKTVSGEELISLLTLYFSVTDLGSVPYNGDCVTVGSAENLRAERGTAVFLLGLNEGEFPKAATDGGILSNAEMAQLEECGVLEDAGEGERESEELLFLYRAVNDAKSLLFASYFEKTVDGSDCAPSIAFNRISALLGKKSLHFSQKELFSTQKTFHADEEKYRLPTLSRADALTLSQSKISAFVLCPYRYYCTYELKLREAKSSKPSYADDGTFLHYIFEQFLRLNVKNGRFEIPAEEEGKLMISEIIDRYLSEIYPIPEEWMDRKTLHLFSRLRTVAEKMLLNMLDEIRNSSFSPALFETSIGSDDGVPAVTVRLSNGKTVRLVGKIDRIDLYRNEEGKTFVRVVDYKSGKHIFSEDDLQTGMDVQLILYLFALQSAGKNLLPAGAAYYYADASSGEISICRSGVISSENGILEASDRTADGIYIKKLQKVTDEELSGMIRQLEETVSGIAEKILAGDARKTPSEDACRFCTVKDRCSRAEDCGKENQ